MKAEDIKEQMAGRWESYFSDRFDLEVETMQGVPCPFCGGDDRFSWTNYRDAGGYLCRGHAEGRYTDGIAFAQELWRVRGMEARFRDVLGDIDHWLSNAPTAPPKALPLGKPAVSPEAVQRLSQVLSGDWSAVALVTHPYVQKKGLGHLVPLANRQTRVKPWGAGEVIVVPQFDPREPFGKPIGAEVIAVDGKWSVKGGKRGVHALPHRDPSAPLVCVEGWASALAAAEMLPEFQVVACGGKKTLVRQAEALRESTDKRVVLCWEDDGDADEAPAGAVVMPRTDRGNDPADWLHDAGAVREFQTRVAVADSCATLPVSEIGVEQYEQYEQ